jgi:hypothetical protein
MKRRSSNIGVISTNSYAIVQKFCSLSVCFQISRFASRQRASREEKTEKNRVTTAATPSNLKGRPKTKANT